MSTTRLGSGVQRLVSSLGRASTITGATGGSGEQLELQERRLRGYTEEFLAPVRSALHVHLGGPRDARIKQGMPTRPSVTGRRRPPGRPDRKSRIASTVRATTRGVR